MSFEQIIANLIGSKKEGDFWDFKELPHENNASLLHDILCMANSIHQGDRYIIFGVTDPSSGTVVQGLTPNQADRKTQVQIVDFLRTKKFAGDTRPQIELRTITLGQKELDILIIFDNYKKPYYLTEDYQQYGKKVMAYHIYSRTNDGNTPIAQSADVDTVENMWRQRFGLHLAPLERMKLLLSRPAEWFKDIGNKDMAYHLQQPEYTITFSESKAFWEPYTLFYTNSKAFLGNAIFKFHSTILFELEYMYCDEMRIVLPVPETKYIRLSNSEQWFYYYDISKLSGIFLHFLTNGKLDFQSRGSYAPFIVFKDAAQQKEFIEVLKNNEEKVLALPPDFWSQQAKKQMIGDKARVVDPLFIYQAYQFFLAFQLKRL